MSAQCSAIVCRAIRAPECSNSFHSCEKEYPAPRGARVIAQPSVDRRLDYLSNSRVRLYGRAGAEEAHDLPSSHVFLD